MAKNKHKGKPSMKYVDVLTKKKLEEEVYKQIVYDSAFNTQLEVRTQRVLWMFCIAMHRAFGIGKRRFLKFSQELIYVADWYNEMIANVDGEYAHEKLRREASNCFDVDVWSLHDDDLTKSVEEYRNRG